MTGKILSVAEQLSSNASIPSSGRIKSVSEQLQEQQPAQPKSAEVYGPPENPHSTFASIFNANQETKPNVVGLSGLKPAPPYKTNVFNFLTVPQQALFGGVKAGMENLQGNKPFITDTVKEIAKGSINAAKAGVLGDEQNKVKFRQLMDLRGISQTDPNQPWYSGKNLPLNITNATGEFLLDPLNVAFGSGLESKLLSKGAKTAEELNKASKVVEGITKEAKPITEMATTEGNLANDISRTSDKFVSSYQKEPLTLNSLNNLKDKAYTRLVDTQNPLKLTNDYAKKVMEVDPTHDIQLLGNNARNSQGTVNHILEDSLVNREGTHIGESLGNIYKELPKTKVVDFRGNEITYDNLLNDYMGHQHNINRMAVDKPVFGSNITPDMSQRVLNYYDKQYPQLKSFTDRVRQNWDGVVQHWGVDTGLVTPEQVAKNKELYPNYIPTYRAEKPVNTNGISGFVGKKELIKKATGSEKDIIKPLQSYINLTDRFVKASRNNEVGLGLLNTIRKNPEAMTRFAEEIPTNQGIIDEINNIIKTDGIEGLTNKIGEQFDKTVTKTKDMGNIVTVMENGKPVQMKINDPELLRSLRGMTESQPGTLERIGRTFTNPFKTVVTGKNPIFAVRNIARDVPTSFVNSQTINPAKYTGDMFDAANQMLIGGKDWQEYKALGGEHGNFFAGDAKKLEKYADQLINGKGKLQIASDALGSFNNFTESVPRFAEYLRTVKNGGRNYASKIQGIYNANDITVNFARHGDITKAIDSFVPYFNAGVQGAEKVARQMVKKPLQTIGKGALAITGPTLLVDYANRNNPYYKDLDNRTKDDNILIPNYWGEKDDKGIPKTFIKVPKTRELGVLFGSLEERLIRLAQGDKNAFKGFSNTFITNSAPANPVDNNVFMPWINAYFTNKDFAGRTIVPQSMQDLSPQYQYDETTSEIGKILGKIGGLTGLGPKQVDYLLKSYLGVISQVGLPAATKGGKPLKAITNQFTADPLYSNQATTDFYDNYDKFKKLAADRNFTQNLPSSEVTPEEDVRNIFANQSKNMTELNKGIRLINASNLPQIKKDDLVKKLRFGINDIAKKTNSMLK